MRDPPAFSELMLAVELELDALSSSYLHVII